MAVIKRMSSKAKVSKIENYLKSEEKTSENLISALNCDSENFAKECQMTSELYNKNQNKEDRKYYHIVQSFSPQDNERLTHEQAHQIGKEFAEKNFKGYEVLIVTHKDKDHIHNHIVVNSVSYENGLKYRADNKSLLELRKTSNELCKKNNLTHSIQDLNKRAKDKMPTGELREIVKGGESWKQDLKAKIEDVAGKSQSKEEFKAGLQQKYNIALTERTRKSKGKSSTIYEYQSEKMKNPCGEHRLGVDYGKEHLENGFIRQSQKEATREDRGITGARAEAGAAARTVSASEVIRMANDVEQSNSTKRKDSEQRRGNSELERANRETAQERLRTQGSERNRANKSKNNSRSER